MQIKVYPKITNGQGDTVTCGISFGFGKLLHPQSFKLLDNTGAELRIYFRITSRWFDGSIRTARVQWIHDGESFVTGLFETRDTIDLQEMPNEEIPTDHPYFPGFMEPAFYCIMDPGYLMDTRLIPPSSAKGTSKFDTEFWPTHFLKAKDFDRREIFEGWLFDPTTTVYQQAMRTGDLEQYRIAYLLHEMWISSLEVTGKTGILADGQPVKYPEYCTMGFDRSTLCYPYSYKSPTGKSGAGCDSKYQNLEPYRLHLALTGDDSWKPDENGVPSPLVDTTLKAINYLATVMYGPRGQCPMITVGYKTLHESFTERNVGQALQTILAGAQTLNSTKLYSYVDTVIDHLYNMMTNNPDGYGDRGFFAHSLDAHEDEKFPPWIGTVKSTTPPAEPFGIGKVVIENNPTGFTHLLPKGCRVRINGDYDVVSDAVELSDGCYEFSIAKYPVTPFAVGSVCLALNVPNTSISSRQLEWRWPTDRMFSPWMMVNVANPLWARYWIPGCPQSTKDKIAHMLLGMSDAIIKYGIDATGQADDGSRTVGLTFSLQAKIAAEYNVKIFNSHISSKRVIPCAPYPRYFATTFMASPRMNRPYAQYLFENGGYADQHSPEMIFTLSCGLFFEQKASRIRIKQELIAGFERFCIAAQAGGNPQRRVNWSHRDNAMGTKEEVYEMRGLQDVVVVADSLTTPIPDPGPDPDPDPDPIPDPDPDPKPPVLHTELPNWPTSVLYVLTTKEIYNGKSWHYQGEPLWKPKADVKLTDCVATTSDAAGYLTRTWRLLANVKATDYVRMATVKPANLTHKDTTARTLMHAHLTFPITNEEDPAVIAELKAQIEELTKTITETRASMEALQVENTEQDKQLAALSLELEGMEQTLTQRETQINDMTTELTANKVKLTKITEAIKLLDDLNP